MSEAGCVSVAALIWNAGIVVANSNADRTAAAHIAPNC